MERAGTVTKACERRRHRRKGVGLVLHHRDQESHRSTRSIVGWRRSYFEIILSGRGTMNAIRLVVASVAMLGLFGSAFAQLSDSEQKLIAAIKSRSPDALAFLEKTVRINSGTLNVKGVQEVGALYRAEFEALGFTTRWSD